MFKPTIGRHNWVHLLPLLLFAACGEQPSLNDLPAEELKAKWLGASAVTQAAYFARVSPELLVPSLLHELSELSGLPIVRNVPMSVLSAKDQQAQMAANLAQSEQRLPLLAEMAKGLQAVSTALDLSALFGEDELDAVTGEPDGDEPAAEQDGLDDEHAPPSEQGVLLGFYDAYDKQFYMRRGLSHDSQLRTMRHELVHALQDQTYPLDEHLARTLPEFDRLMAVKAVVEGQAVLLPEMVTAWRQVAPGRPAAELGLAARAAQHRQALPASLPGRGLRRAPWRGLLQHRRTEQAKELSAIDFVLFPYQEGAEFMHHLARSRPRRTIGHWIRTTFEQPPESTREIMHPEAYRRRLAGKTVAPIDANALLQAAGAPPAWRSALGELVMQGYMSTLAKPWLARHLERDEVLVFAQPNATKPLVVWLTAWDSVASANAFAEAANVRQSGLSGRDEGSDQANYQSCTQRSARMVGVMANLAQGSSADGEQSDEQAAFASAMRRGLNEAMGRGPLVAER